VPCWPGRWGHWRPAAVAGARLCARRCSQWQVGGRFPVGRLLFLSLLPGCCRAALAAGGGWAAGLASTLALHLRCWAPTVLTGHQWGGDLLLARHRGRGALIKPSRRSASAAPAPPGWPPASASAATTELPRSIPVRKATEHAAGRQQAPWCWPPVRGRAPCCPGQAFGEPGLGVTAVERRQPRATFNGGQTTAGLLLPIASFLLAWHSSGSEAGPRLDRAEAGAAPAVFQPALSGRPWRGRRPAPSGAVGMGPMTVGWQASGGMERSIAPPADGS